MFRSSEMESRIWDAEVNARPKPPYRIETNGVEFRVMYRRLWWWAVATETLTYETACDYMTQWTAHHQKPKPGPWRDVTPCAQVAEGGHP